MSSEYWLTQSITYYWRWRYSEHTLRCTLDRIGESRLSGLATHDTVEYYQRNPHDWTKSQILDALVAAELIRPMIKDEGGDGVWVVVTEINSEDSIDYEQFLAELQAMSEDNHDPAIGLPSPLAPVQPLPGPLISEEDALKDENWMVNIDLRREEIAALRQVWATHQPHQLTMIVIGQASRPDIQEHARNSGKHQANVIIKDQRDLEHLFHVYLQPEQLIQEMRGREIYGDLLHELKVANAMPIQGTYVVVLIVLEENLCASIWSPDCPVIHYDQEPPMRPATGPHADFTVPREDTDQYQVGEPLLSRCTGQDAKFGLGTLWLTTGLRARLHEGEWITLVQRHLTGDFGACGKLDEITVTEEEIKGGVFATDDEGKQNKVTLIRGKGRIMSVYDDVWVITESDGQQAETTVLLSQEY